MGYVVCLLIGYGLGCINPAYIIARFLHIDLQKTGTQNLGTTNVFLSLGKGYGILTLIIDVLKGFLSVKLCQCFFPDLLFADLLGGFAAVIGHIFPIYLCFKGGKGLATLIGFMLANDWKSALFILLLGGLMALIFNYGCFLSFTSAILFPVVCGLQFQSVIAFLITCCCCFFIIHKHLKNLEKIRTQEELPLRTVIQNQLFPSKAPKN